LMNVVNTSQIGLPFEDRLRPAEMKALEISFQ
jgi:hypothetical protein